MSTSNECCGWLGWAELAGIGADGSRLKGSAPVESPPPSVPASSRSLPFITAAVRRALEGRVGVAR